MTAPPPTTFVPAGQYAVADFSAFESNAEYSSPWGPCGPR